MKSMTGFGRGKYQNDGREYSVEIKSVNHKYSDISIKMPRTISYLEESVKKEILNNVSRGKIDVYISFINNSSKGKNIKINKELVQVYISELKEVAKEAGISSEIPVIEISKFPDVLMIENGEDEEILGGELLIAVKEAINNFVNMRECEGKKISEDLQKRIETIAGKVNEIAQLSTNLIDEYVTKLETRIKEILKTDTIDEARLAQEVVIFADKSSVEEEITRLKSHISQFESLLKSDIVGKKLDFIVQEMNRETNTIGSKANSLDITNLVINVKTEIENIREQIQNIE